MLACFGLTRLLTLYLTGITSQEAFCLQRRFILFINFNECASDSKAKCLCLAFETATVQIYFDIVLLSNTEFVQWLLNDELKDGRRKILIKRALVDSDLTFTFTYENACNCCFASSECINYFH